MDVSTVVIAFSALTGGISAADTARKFIVHEQPSPKSLLQRSAVFTACVVVIAYVVVAPILKSESRKTSPALPQNTYSVSDSAEAHYEKAKTFFFAHDRPDAIQEAKLAIQIKPSYDDAHKLLASCYGIDDNLDAAAAEFKTASDINPDDMEAEMGLATALDAEGERQKADDVYRYILRNPASNPDQLRQAKARLHSLTQ
jgi:Tfp pilus assembly protein PilF